ncbi:MAG TPA: carboxypeptidase M32 [Phycisphaerae bacterium]|nr:carboxypeptidase M32 [Phycisphaerae bacterium]
MTALYQSFLTLIREAGILGSVEALLDWDSETFMPPGGLATRAEQIAFIAGQAHERRTNPRIGELLANLEVGSLDPIAGTNVRETRRSYDRATKIPVDLVRRIAKASTLAKDAWGKARAESNFDPFAPHLTELLDLKRQVADLVGYSGERYDALLDEYEPGMTAAGVEKVFGSLRGPLSEFVKKIAQAKRKPDVSILHRHFPRAAQETLCREFAAAIGFDFTRGRLDVSKHPFCSGTGPGDVRLTTRYYEDFLSPSLFGVLHEAGHGLYEQGLPVEHQFTPAGNAVSLGIHESQSRMWENFVGRSRDFWEGRYDRCRSAFPEALGDVPLDAFYGAINFVQPSLIRVEADEVTYNLHIILRFELEREMIAGRLQVRDVPEAWNAKMRELLGLTPPSNADGCLQDIHWSMGAFGYFPTYALGNLYAAQFFAASRKAIPDLSDRIRRCDFRLLLDWLRTNIHAHGQRYRPAELVQRVTGAPLSIEPFMDYLRTKFSPIYGL